METMINTKLQSIVEKTVLLRVNFRIMGNSRKISTNILSTSANGKLLKIQKTLLESKELEAIKKSDAQMRAILHDMCVPYDMGLDLLPRVSVDSARDKMIAYRSTRKELVNVFVAAYPDLQKETEVKMEELALELNVPFAYLYNAADYPSPEYVASKFDFSWDFLSLTVPDELKLSNKFQEASEDLAAKINNVQEEITLVMRQSLLDLVTHLKASLEPSTDGKQKRLHATTVTNLQEFLASLPSRNITGDEELSKLAADVSKLIHPGVNADLLKKDESFKSTVIDQMGSIAGELSKLVEVIPGRKFRGAGVKPNPVTAPPSPESTAQAILDAQYVSPEQVTEMALKGMSLYK